MSTVAVVAFIAGFFVCVAACAWMERLERRASRPRGSRSALQREADVTEQARVLLDEPGSKRLPVEKRGGYTPQAQGPRPTRPPPKPGDAGSSAKP